MRVVVDSDGLIGTVNEQDAHYVKAMALLAKLQARSTEFIYPATVIAESTAILQIRLNKLDIANQILEKVASHLLRVEPVNQEVIIAAVSFLKKDRSRHATLFDGIVAVTAKKHNADAIFSFDRFYKTQGFKLASEL